MKDVINALELHYMVREFQDLVGARLDKVYHRKDELVLQFYSIKTKKVFMFFKLPSTIFLTSNKPDTDESAGGFCMFLRKKIHNLRVASISQIGFERIVKIKLSKEDESFELIIELFNPGNIILIDKDNKILSMQKSSITNFRTIRGGVDYVPLLKEYDALSMSKEELVEVFAKSDKENVVKTLALDLGFGGIYSEEICMLSKIDKNLDKPTSKQIGDLHKAIVKLKDIEINPVKVDNEIHPFKLSNMSDSSELEDSFSLSVGEMLSERFTSKKHDETLSKQGKEIKKIDNIISKQVEKIKNLEKDITINQRLGEVIYENYAKVEELLKVINDAKKTHSYKDIKKKLVEKKVIIDLDEKEQSIIVDL